MSRQVLDQIRDRLGSVELAVILALVVVAGGAGTDALVAAGTAIVTLAAIAVFGWVAEAVDADRTVYGVLLGLLVGGLGAWAFVRESGWPSAGIVAVGAWIVLDSLYERRHGDPSPDEPAEQDDELSEAEVYTRLGHGQWVLEALQDADRPLTADEIRARTGLTGSEFETVVDHLLENGTVERTGTGYVVDERNLGGVAFVRNLVRTVGGRLLRPFRLFRPAE